ncbi:MAG: hypothetical protein CYG60_22030 [Actinobacteria bacterium]|nr:MAG: hypothetical protein CYG60_22030 [Actinomycetota bacterium]
MEPEAKLIDWIGKALSEAFFYLFLLIGGFLFVLAVVNAVAAFRHPMQEPEKYLLDAIGLGTIGAATCDLGTVFRSVIRQSFGASESSTHEEIRGELASFLRVIVIAAGVEGLILVFKSVGGGRSEMLPLAAMVIAAAALLLVAIGVYHRLTVTGGDRG